MSLGNGNPKEGDKGSNFNYELKVLQGLEAIAVAIENGNYTEILYEDLYDLYYAGNLTPGRFYAITDYRLVYDTPRYNTFGGACDAAYINTQFGPTETLVVQAIASNALAPQAYLPSAPYLYLEYDITYTMSMMKGVPAKGRITRYIDHWYNNVSAYYDVRYVQYDRFSEYISDGVNNISGTNFEINFDTGTLTCLDNNALFTSELSSGLVIYTGAGKINVITTSIVDDNTLNFLTETGITGTITSPGPLYHTIITGALSATETYVGQVIQEGSSTTYNCMLLDDSNLNIELGPVNTSPFLLDNNIIGGPRTPRNVSLGGNCTGNTIIGYVDGFSLASGSNGNYFGYVDATLNNIKFNLQASGNVFYCNMNTCTFDKCEDNRVTLDFNDNSIKGTFSANTITGYFQNNNIQCSDFSDNTIKDTFSDNSITCSSFSNNLFNSSFGTNAVLSGTFYGNSFGEGVQNCTMRSTFNTITAGKKIDSCDFIGFSNNNLGNSALAYLFCKFPISGVDFSSATNIFIPYNKTIESRSDGNTILWYIDGSNTVVYSAITA